jgi:site-specific DNA-cytosine methylase
VHDHASFFSGVGGLDLGLERAGWRTVSFSEVDPYACTVLAERWPGVPNLGDITRLGASVDEELRQAAGQQRHEPRPDAGVGWPHATLWSGGFPCQDLSVAGKRRGMGEGTRSGLAFAFLDLVGRHRPPWFLLENVPGLLSSHGGRDLGVLLDTVGQLGYGWAYRILDARHFGVPQRRRRVFVLCHTLDGRPDADGPAEVLAVGTRCRRHPPTGGEAWEEPADAARNGVDVARPVVGTAWKRHDDDTDTLVLDRPPPDAHRVRAPDGLAGRLDGGDGLAATLNSGGNDGGFRTEPGEHLVYVKAQRAHDPDDCERWEDGGLSLGLDANGMAARTATAVIGPTNAEDTAPGLDSHRYRCCGNGVVAPVAEWIGMRLRAYLEGRPG